MTNHCDNAEYWERLIGKAARLGVFHGTQGQKALTEDGLIKVLVSAYGQFGYRRGHASALRAAYGAGYRGIALSRGVNGGGL